MTNPVVLRLNAEALAALFPEGSQARLDLQAAVVAEFVRKNLKPSTLGSAVQAQLTDLRHEVQAEVYKAKQAFIDDLLAQQGAAEHDGRIVLSKILKESIRKAFIAEFSKVRGEVIDEAVEKNRAYIHAEAARLTQDELRKTLNARIRSILDELNVKESI